MTFPSGIVISCQAPRTSELANSMVRMAIEAQKGGASAVRLEGVGNVMGAADNITIPIIGLRKVTHENGVWITPQTEDAKELVEAGAEFVAADCTGRWGYDEIEKMVTAGISVLADIHTVDAALVAEDMGCIAVATTLSGYTGKKPAHHFYGPDVDLVAQCVSKCTIPVMAEGRYWTPKQIGMARDAGAHAVCVGGGATNPCMITEHLNVVWDGSWKQKAKGEWEPE